MLMCRHCIEAIRSRGDYIMTGEMVYSAEECEEMGITCEWCGEYDDLYEVVAHDSLY